MTDKVYRLLQEKHLNQLDNLNEKNPKLAILFSGGNAVGKSSLSSFLELHLNALVLSNDGVRKIIIDLFPKMKKEERNQLMWEYMLRLYSELPSVTDNGLVVRDAVVDWYYKKIMAPFIKNEYPFYIVQFNLSDEFNLKLINERGDNTILTTERARELFLEHKKKQREFRREYSPNFTVNDNNFGKWELVAKDISSKLQ